ncbi:AraC family ligand binding domain-containing protein [Streptomyces ovatisporus]|uniref:AraC family ligand binding domain-containing protein n=1 Tax=Streptomyces ovatisporus TaxID=1128682 RepID=A0ABV9AHG8_9ACTN
MGAVETGESARHWRHPALPEVDLLRVRYLRRTFARHTHGACTIGAVSEGVEVFVHRGAQHRAGPGGLVLVTAAYGPWAEDGRAPTSAEEDSRGPTRTADEGRAAGPELDTGEHAVDGLLAADGGPLRRGLRRLLRP